MHGDPAGEEAEICHGRGMYLSSVFQLEDMVLTVSRGTLRTWSLRSL